VRWLWRGYSIREILLSPTQLTPVFAHGLPNPRSVIALYKSAAPPPVASAVPIESSRPSPESLVGRIAAMLANSWENLGWSERLVSRMLTCRERAILEQACRGRIRWTRSWWIGLAVSLAITALILIGITIGKRFGAPAIGNGNAVPISLLSEGIIVCLLLCVDFVERLDQTYTKVPSGLMEPGYQGLHPIYPIGWTEYRRVLRKVVWLRVALWTPILFLGFLPDLIFQPELLSRSLIGFASVVMLFGIAVETFGTVFPTAGALLPPSLWEWSIIRFLPAVPLAMLFVAALNVIGAAIAIMPPLAVFGWGLAWVAAYGTQELARWAYQHTQLDFACRETMIPARRGR
jgi:hypothetical protein